MKCFLHSEIDPVAREVASLDEAINLAESLLQSYNKAEPKLKIKWRRDELYPDNFVDYTHAELSVALAEEGTVWLQLADTDVDGLPIMGEIVTICNEQAETDNNKAAQEALDVATAPALATVGKSKTLRRPNQRILKRRNPAHRRRKK